MKVSERLADVASLHRQRIRRDRDGWPYLDAGRFRILDDAGLTATVSAYERELLRRLSGLPGILRAERFGAEVHLSIRPDAVVTLARLGRLQ